MSCDASPTSQALHLRYLASCTCIFPMLITKFSQNIVADTDKNRALNDCHNCSSSFLSIVKSHPLKIPASVLEKVRAGSCPKLFLIDCRKPSHHLSDTRYSYRPQMDEDLRMITMSKLMLSDGHAIVCSEELNFLRLAQRGAPGVPGSSDSRPQNSEHALLARPVGFN